MGQLYAIARNTFLETIRQPVYALVLVSACLLIAFVPMTGAHIYAFRAGTELEQPGARMLAKLGLATALLAGLVLAVFATSGVIHREIEDKTALTVLSKRIGRFPFLLGKYIGASGAIAMAPLVLCAYLMVSLRAGAPVAVYDPVDWGVIACLAGSFVLAILVATFRNYFRGRSWVGSFVLAFALFLGIIFLVYGFVDNEYGFVLREDGPGAFGGYDWEVGKAALLTIESVMILAGVAVAASTRLGPAGNFAVCSMVFLAGLVTAYVHQHVPGVATAVLHRVVPNLQAFWMNRALAMELPISLEYVALASLYAGAYILATLFLAAFLFEGREIA